MIADVPLDVECRSLNEESWREACAERWYQSIREGRDVGEQAIRHWVHRHWPGFLRHRWIQHMLGEKFWLELKRNEFGLLKETPTEMRPVLERIIDRLICGAENLNLVVWLRECPPEERRIIRKLLCTIDVNSHRMRCHFADD